MVWGGWVRQKCRYLIATDKRGYPHNVFLISPRKHMLYPQHMFSWRNKKDISIFSMKKALYLLLCILRHRASNWYWLTVGQGLLSLQQVMVEGDLFISSVSSLSFIFLFLPCPSLSSLLLSLFSLSLGDDTKWPTRVDMSLNPNTISQILIYGGHF